MVNSKILIIPGAPIKMIFQNSVTNNLITFTADNGKFSVKFSTKFNLKSDVLSNTLAATEMYKRMTIKVNL